MKIRIEPHNPNWKNEFKALKADLELILSTLNPVVEHIGSTSIDALDAKPIIDVLVGLPQGANLDQCIESMRLNSFVYYQCYDALMPYRRFFVKHKKTVVLHYQDTIYPDADLLVHSTAEHSSRLAHIHILEYQSLHWRRHIAFRDYLRSQPEVRAQYQKLKQELTHLLWSDGIAYNKAKDPFIKQVEQQALDWYTTKNK